MSKPKFLFVAGVEGSGHHAMLAMARYLQQYQWFCFQGDWHDPLRDHWDPEMEGDLPEDLFESYGEYTHFYDAFSFPFNSRDTMSHPDLIELAELARDEVDLRLLILYRDPRECAWSAFRRKFRPTLEEQIQAITESLNNLCVQLWYIKDYRVLRYNTLVDTPLLYLNSLSEWWRIDRRIIARCFDELERPLGLVGTDDAQRDMLNEAFSYDQMQRWWILWAKGKEL